MKGVTSLAEETPKGLSLQMGTALTLLLGAAMYATSRYSYPLFHTVVEIYSMIVATSVFVVLWNSRHILRRDYLLFIGIAFLFFAILDVPHALAYRGIQLFPGFGANLPTQLFIIQRFMLAASFLIAPVFLHYRVPVKLTLGVYIALTGLALVSVLWLRNFPAAFIEGRGLTPFKVYAEYVISAMFLLAVVSLVVNRRLFDPAVLRLIIGATLAFAASEMMFTLYSTPFGLPNFIGHLAQVLAFSLVYEAVVRTALVRPYALLYRELAESEDRHRQVAERLQSELLKVPESVPGLRIAHQYRSVSDLARIGGDFYDFFELCDHMVAIVLGDVSGKGLDAATATAEVKSTIRAFAHIDSRPSFVLGKTNEVLLDYFDEDQFVTVFYISVDVRNGRANVASAGHPFPIRCSSSGCVPRSLPVNPPLGLFPDTGYEQTQWELERGQSILLYSDGLTDSRRGNEFFGEEGVQQTLAELRGRPSEEIVGGLISEALLFSNGILRDDIAVLRAEYVGTDGELT